MLGRGHGISHEASRAGWKSLVRKSASLCFQSLLTWQLLIFNLVPWVELFRWGRAPTLEHPALSPEPGPAPTVNESVGVLAFKSAPCGFRWAWVRPWSLTSSEKRREVCLSVNSTEGTCELWRLSWISASGAPALHRSVFSIIPHSATTRTLTIQCNCHLVN